MATTARRPFEALPQQDKMYSSRRATCHGRFQKAFSPGLGCGNCHLANIALRLGRKLTWDPESETLIGDDEANAMLSREPREGYEIRA